MATTVIEEIATMMGFCPESGLPMANEENKQLFKLIEKMGVEKNELNVTLVNYNDRAQRLITHSQNSEVTLAQNMKLIFAFQSDLRSEQSMFKVAERERSKLQRDLKDINEELDRINNYKTTTENDIDKRTQIVNELSNRINWIKSALIEWRQCMDEGNAANELIEKYCKQDQKIYFEMDTKRKFLENCINNERKNLIDMAEEQKSLEQNLDRTAHLYRKAHQERRDMVDTWKSAVNQMNQQERAILNTETDYENALKRWMKKQAELKSEENNLDNMIASNHEIEANIEELNEEISGRRERLDYLIDTISLRENEVDILKKEIQGLSHRVQQQRNENRQNFQLKCEKERELKNLIEGNKKLEQSHDNLKNKNMNSQERLRILEEMIDSEARARKELTLALKRTNDILFRTEQQLLKAKSDEKVIHSEMGGMKVSISAAEVSVKNAQKNLAKQTEDEYDTSLKVIVLDGRVGLLKGSSIDPLEERKRLTEAARLEKYNGEVLKVLHSLQTQTAKLEKNMKLLTAAYNTDMAQVEDMNFKIKQAELYCAGGTKKLRQVIRDNQEKIVELSVLKMRVHEMTKEAEECDSRTFNLSQHRLELSKAVKEKSIEIKAQQDILFVKRKHLLEELNTLKCDIGERGIKIEAIKSRYELIVKLLGTNEDGSMVTATQMKVENAQEKQMLLEEGNALNASVIKAEQEIQAMENTLALMNCSNEVYRRNFEDLDQDACELEKLNCFKADYCQELSVLKELQTKILKEERFLMQRSEEEELISQQINDLLKERVEKQEVLAKLHKELVEQSVKLDRARRDMKLAWKSLGQRSLDVRFVGDYRRKLQSQEIAKRNDTALQLMADIVNTNEEMASQTLKLLYAKGIQCPNKKKCRTLEKLWRSDFSDVSIPSSSLPSPQTSSRSSVSVTKLSPSIGASVVSLDFPIQDFSAKQK